MKYILLLLTLFPAILQLQPVSTTAIIPRDTGEPVGEWDKVPYLAWTYPIDDTGELSWSPDSMYLALGQEVWAPDNLLVFMRNGSLYWSKSLDQVVNSVEWSPDGEYLAVGWGGIVYGDVIGGLTLYNRSGGLLWEKRGMVVKKVRWLSNYNILVATRTELRLYSLNGTLIWSVLVAVDSLIYGIRISPDETKVIVSILGSAVIVDIDGPILTYINESGIGDLYPALAWSPSGDRFALGYNNVVRIYSSDGEPLSTITIDTYAIDYITWWPTGEYIVVSSIYGRPSGWQYVTVHLLAANGTLLWERRLGVTTTHHKIIPIPGSDAFIETGSNSFYVINLYNNVMYSYGIRVGSIALAPDYTLAVTPLFPEKIYVFNWNTLPKPVVEYYPQHPEPGDLVVFNASESFDPDGEIVDYQWSINGETYSGPVVNYTFPSYGEYTVSLTLTDNLGAEFTKTIVVKVLSPPIISYNISPSQIIAGSPAIFNASESFDPDGEIAYITWCFGDGTCLNGSVVEHTYSSPGTYNVSLRIIDTDGLTNETSFEITVYSKPVITITVDAEATIFINGTNYGTIDPSQPLELELMPGDYLLNITAIPTSDKLLNVAREESLSLDPGSSRSIEIHLPAKPVLQITCNTSCKIFINGTHIGEADPEEPLEYTLPPGVWVLNITGLPLQQGYKPTTLIETFTLQEDEARNITLNLQPAETQQTTTPPTTPTQQTQPTTSGAATQPISTETPQQGIPIEVIVGGAVVAVIALGVVVFILKKT